MLISFVVHLLFYWSYIDTLPATLSSVHTKNPKSTSPIIHKKSPTSIDPSSASISKKSISVEPTKNSKLDPWDIKELSEQQKLILKSKVDPFIKDLVQIAQISEVYVPEQLNNFAASSSPDTVILLIKTLKSKIPDSKLRSSIYSHLLEEQNTSPKVLETLLQKHYKFTPNQLHYKFKIASGSGDTKSTTRILPFIKDEAVLKEHKRFSNILESEYSTSDPYLAKKHREITNLISARLDDLQ